MTIRTLHTKKEREERKSKDKKRKRNIARFVIRRYGIKLGTAEAENKLVIQLKTSANSKSKIKKDKNR